MISGGWIGLGPITESYTSTERDTMLEPVFHQTRTSRPPKEESEGFWILPEEKEKKLAYDVSKWQRYIWDDAVEGNSSLKQQVKWSGSKIGDQELFSEICTEVFHTLNSYDPKPIPDEELTKEGKEVKEFHNKIQSQNVFKEIRDRCVGNTTLSVYAVDKIVNLLNTYTNSKKDENNQTTKKYKEQIDKLEQEKRTIKSYLDSMPGNEALKKDLKNINNAIAAGKRLLESAQNDSSLNIDMEGFLNKLNSESEKIVEDLDDAANAIDCLNSMAGKEGADHGNDFLAIDQETVMMALKNKSIKKAFELAGRLKRLASNKLKEKCDGKSEIVGITSGNDIARLLPNEMMLLANEQTKYLFAKKFYESSLMQYKLTGKEPKGRGPVYLLVDVSGSMAGFREQYAGAVSIALMYLANQQKRDFRISHFDVNILTDYKYDKGNNLRSIIQAAIQPPSKGGTNIAHCLFKAMDSLKKEKSDKKTDIILITDGNDVVNPQKIEKLKKENNIRLFTIMCGGENNGLKTGSDLYVDSSMNIDAAEDVFERIIE